MPASRIKAGVPAGPEQSPGQIAYEAYVAAGNQDAGFPAGVRMPAWDEQEHRIKSRWEIAALAVVDAHVLANPPPAGA